MSRVGRPDDTGAVSGWLRRWFADLALGARLAFAGGREGRLRTALTAIGVGLGVAVLLLAASTPGMFQARDERAARQGFDWSDMAASEPGPNTALVLSKEVEFGYREVVGRHVQAEGQHPPIPPGLSRLPADGESMVSPALEELLRSPDGELLRPLVGDRVVGVIGSEGLISPGQLLYYRGEDRLSNTGTALRVASFGTAPQPTLNLAHPVLLLLFVVGLVVLLLPVAMFIAVAVRFGGEQRDRRLAALRLAGVDRISIGRVAAGETLVAAAAGLVVGWAAFLAGRPLVARLEVFGFSAFSHEVRPSLPLAGLAMVAVLAMAVAGARLSMRGLAIEPLGVFRRTDGGRRRLWWRLVLPLVGLALFVPALGWRTLDDPSGRTLVYLAAGGVALLLLGLAALLPVLVAAAVRWWRGRGGVPLLLATRRIQVGGGSTGRIVNGIAVATAGAIGLQLFFAAVAAQFITERARWADVDAGTATVWLDGPIATGDGGVLAADASGDGGPGPTGERLGSGLTELAGRFTDTDGVESAFAVAEIRTTDGSPISVGDCRALATVAGAGTGVEDCADGDVFALSDAEWAEDQLGRQIDLAARPMVIGDGGGPPERRIVSWTVPKEARPFTVPGERYETNVPDLLVTPAAMAGTPVPVTAVEIRVAMDPAMPDAYQRVQSTAAGIDPLMGADRPTTVVVDPDFAAVRRVLLIGTVGTLGLIGSSLLVGIIEQLRERRRQLAVLVAFGVRRRTLATSVLWQALLPTAVGIALAIGTGIGLGGLLVRLLDVTRESPAFAIDWGVIGWTTAIAAGVVLVVFALALPVLWRSTRPDGLRTE